MSKLDVSNNSIRSEGCSALAGILNQSSITDLNLANNYVTYDAQDKSGVMDGIMKLAGVLEDNGALSKISKFYIKLGRISIFTFN